MGELGRKVISWRAFCVSIVMDCLYFRINIGIILVFGFAYFISFETHFISIAFGFALYHLIHSLLACHFALSYLHRSVIVSPTIWTLYFHQQFEHPFTIYCYVMLCYVHMIDILTTLLNSSNEEQLNSICEVP